MSDEQIPDPPHGTGAAGLALWREVTSEYDLEEHELALLRELVRTVDLLDALDERVREDGLMVVGPNLAKRVHPAAVEARQQRIALARLAAALRLPAGDTDDKQQDARRPQRRVGVRGVYGIRGAV